MQKVTIAKVSRKSGENKSGPWTNTRITGTDGTEFSTFHKSALELVAGWTIELDPQVSSKGNNFDDFNVLDRTAAPVAESSGPAPNGGDRFKRDTEGIAFEYDLKAQAEAIKNDSIESQTIFNGAVRLLEAGAVWPDRLNAPIEAVIEKALAWADSHFGGSEAPREPMRAKSSAPAEKPPGNGQRPPSQAAPVKSADTGDDPSEFPHIGALLSWCTKKGISAADFKTIVGVQDADLPKLNVMEAYATIQEWRANPIFPDKA